MKIAYLTTSPLPSEKANAHQSIEVARALYHTGVQVEFFCPKDNPSLRDKEVIRSISSFYGEHLPFNFRFCRKISVKRRFSSVLTVPLLVKLVLSAGEYDYYYIRNKYLLMVMVALKMPVIFEEHQWDSYSNPLKNKLLRCFTFKAARKKACKLFVCISEELRKRWLAKGLDPHKTITAHDAVDLQLFSPVVSKTKARRSLGLIEDGVIISYVGSLYQNRAISDIIWAAEKLREVHFRFVGGPEPQRKKFEQFARDATITNVEFVGRVPRKGIPIQLFASDIVLFTMGENTITNDICSPMKIFEYLASETLIVAPDLPSMREVLRPDFSCLYTFPDRNSLLLNLKKAVALVRTGQAKEMAKRGRLLVEQKYTWHRRSHKILETLENLGRRKLRANNT